MFSNLAPAKSTFFMRVPDVVRIVSTVPLSDFPLLQLTEILSSLLILYSPESGGTQSMEM